VGQKFFVCKMNRKKKSVPKILLLLFLYATNICQAQQLGEYVPPPKRPKPQKIVPKFPPQFHSRDTVGRAQKIKDSIAKIGIKKPTPRTNFGPDTIIKIISTKEDLNGNITTEKEYSVGKFRWKAISMMPGKFNRPFSLDTINKDSITIQVIKKAHRMYVYHKHRFLTSYKVVFGPDPYKQKTKEGDKRTPEGWFKILAVRPHRDWQTFMLLDYPNEESYKIFKDNLVNGEVTKDARIGGAIGIHSVAPDCDYFIEQRRNWTDGCIALTHKDMAELTTICQAGTPICIKIKADTVLPPKTK
jgi:L,D-transpeptidase catalytic domain